MIVSLRNVSRTFAASDVETAALNHISIDIAAGEFVAITGPSGCGKSTLLSVIGLLDEPTEGSVQILGAEVGRGGDKVRTHHRKRNVGFIFQGFNLIPELTVRQNVEVGLKYRPISRREWPDRVAEAIDNVGLTSRTNHYPSQLSGGQQQRTAIARAMVGRPPLILADEPTGNLDSTNGSEVMKLMMELVGEGATLIMVTHSEEQAALADRVIAMRDGMIVS